MLHETELALRVATLPLLGALGVVAWFRDQAAAARVRDDEDSAVRAVSWDRLTPEQLALVLDWRYGA